MGRGSVRPPACTRRRTCRFAGRGNPCGRWTSIRARGQGCHINHSDCLLGGERSGLVSLGLVASLNRPGGNLTGMSTLTTPLVAKGIELLKELLPVATGMAYLANPSNGGGETSAAFAAAKNLGIALHVLNASTEAEIEA